MVEVLSHRALNRATLARQHLLARTTMPAKQMVAHLIGMQAQAPNPPYTGLWSRLEGFDPVELSQLIIDREVVRIALMRSTIHLVTAPDAAPLRAWLQPTLDRALTGAYRKYLDGVDLAELIKLTRATVETEPQTLGELGAELAKRWPGHDVSALYNAGRTAVPLVQVPPRGLWGASGQAKHTTLESWLGGSAEPAEPEKFVYRYLQAFGPATVRDAQIWCGATRLAEVFKRLDLVTFQNEQGQALYDLPEASRPDPDTPAPPRLLAEWDNVLLSYADRQRIIDPKHHPVIYTKNGVMPGPVLVDGFAAGTWRIQQNTKVAALTITLWDQAPRAVRQELEVEGAAMLQFAAAEVPDHQIIVVTA